MHNSIVRINQAGYHPSNTGMDNSEFKPQTDFKPEASFADFQKAVTRVNQSLDLKSTQLEITVDKDTNRTVATVTDRETGEIIRQVPSREFMEWEKEFTRVIGLLFDKKA